MARSIYPFWWRALPIKVASTLLRIATQLQPSLIQSLTSAAAPPDESIGGDPFPPGRLPRGPRGESTSQRKSRWAFYGEALDEMTARTVCRICGETWNGLGTHVARGHGISAKEYRAEYRYHPNLSLTSPDTDARLRAAAKAKHEQNPDVLRRAQAAHLADPLSAEKARATYRDALAAGQVIERKSTQPCVRCGIILTSFASDVRKHCPTCAKLYQRESMLTRVRPASDAAFAADPAKRAAVTAALIAGGRRFAVTRRLPVRPCKICGQPVPGVRRVCTEPGGGASACLRESRRRTISNLRAERGSRLNHTKRAPTRIP